jgi:hypothetical protein
MKIFTLKVIIISCFFLILPFLNSQAQNTVSQNTNLSISANPANPSPGDQVIVSLQSYSLDLNRATITWSVDDIVKKTDLGMKNYSLQAGPAGRPVRVKARIELGETLIDKELIFIPAGVDLIFEAVAYTPPFYKGKVMNTNQGTVVVVAFPEMFNTVGTKYSTKDLIYNWKKDGIVIQEVSGVGKNYLTFSGTIPVRDAEIEVSVSSLDQSVTANQVVSITADSPKIIFYENSPIYGIMMNKAIKNSVQLLSDEFSVIAVPFFFSTGYAGTPDLKYAWTLNNRSVENQDPKNSFTVRQETPGAGTANIGLKISNNVRIFQFTDNAFTINFQKQ